MINTAINTATTSTVTFKGIPPFQDEYPAFTPTGHVVTNEDHMLWAELLGRRRFKRVATIASGGEVPLFVLLPRAESVIAIDHSYRALAAFYLKILMLDALGPRDMKKLMDQNDYKLLVTEAGKHTHLLPAELQAQLKKGTISLSLVHSGISPIFPSSEINNLRSTWHYVSEATLKRVCQRLDRLTIIHGDLTDLSKHGEFDLMYISNALQHAGRDRQAPKLDVITQPLKDGGSLMMATSNYDCDKTGPKDWEILRSKLTYNTNVSMQWSHRIIKKKKVVVCSKA